MNHFIEISQLSKPEVMALLKSALSLKNGSICPQYPAIPLATLFYENSTRTRISFDLAAKRLGMPVVNVDIATSSEAKGESIIDTVKTLTAMGIKCFVIRHKEAGLPIKLAKTCGEGIHVINAGDGMHAHPTQAMLDFMTIMEQKPDLSSLKIAILGDIRHSRVANSLQCLAATLNVGELSLVAPEQWQPSVVHYGTVTDSLRDGLAGADVIICLRVQSERFSTGDTLDLTSYRKAYALTKTTLAYAKKEAMVMHPGPINRSVEIDDEVADGPQSYILQQVQNGVFMRMAILSHLISGSDSLA